MGLCEVGNADWHKLYITPPEKYFDVKSLPRFFPILTYIQLHGLVYQKNIWSLKFAKMF
jgi:hypothetical protein